MRNRNIVVTISLLLGLLLLMSSCGKMDEKYRPFLKGGEIRYSVQPDTIMVRSGYERVELSWNLINAPRVIRCDIYWNNKADSVRVNVERSADSDTLKMATIIDGLLEGSYTFTVYTYDEDGNHSIAKEATGYVYGAQYLASLSNRLIKSAEKFDDRSKIEWYAAHEQVVGVELRYSDEAGGEHALMVGADDQTTYLDNRPQGDTLRYRTLYRTDSLSIDTFYTAYATVMLTDPVPVELDKSQFAEFVLPTDAPLYNASANPVSNLWDGNMDTWYRSANKSGEPHWYSFDLGDTIQLTSYTAWQRGAYKESEYWLLYDNADPKEWEVWGSTDPAADGSFDGWTLLQTCQSVKPSGLPGGENSEEDMEAARAGEHFEFPAHTPPVRYIRIKVLSTWDPSSADHSFFGELSFWGIQY